MRLETIQIENFRNIGKAQISFSEGVNLWVGDNAQGKTNALEAVYLFARGKSFRRCKEADMVKFGEAGFSLSVSYENAQGKGQMSYTLYNGERSRTKNGYRIGRVSEMIGSLRAVLFFPDHLNLVKGGPEERRTFLDIAISQIYPYYIGAYAAYKHALEERNYLLRMASRSASADYEQIEAWSQTLARYAVPIYRQRRLYVKKLEEYVEKIGEEISAGKDRISLCYHADIGEVKEGEELSAYCNLFRENIRREIAAGTTLFGITRDDVNISLNGYNARLYASQGQQRSMVLAMKMGEGEVCRAIGGEYPVFLLDDVLSELDGKRRSFLLDTRGEKQLVITGCTEGTDSFIFDPHKKIYVVSDGKFFPKENESIPQKKERGKDT